MQGLSLTLHIIYLQKLNTVSQISREEADPAPQTTSKQAEQGLIKSYLRSQAAPKVPSPRVVGVRSPIPTPPRLPRSPVSSLCAGYERSESSVFNIVLHFRAM